MVIQRTHEKTASQLRQHHPHHKPRQMIAWQRFTDGNRLGQGRFVIGSLEFSAYTQSLLHSSLSRKTFSPTGCQVRCMVAADIVHTVALQATLQSVLVLG